ncbi:GTP-binding protein [Geoalkalibacter halelectricus]|uniref:GTPase domain-containing protein n=1 Tax=Geoalkalibacter halelectricus TaxID=2847045 RepID=A0ABY5ZSI3_9BACT|nr:GTPase domain-containing protein [Geoalkalibacter halelectricus]MDO3377416.1 GTPase domain-containing protein [Geoalkalibacter halelectricus]UWZ80825.1 GTPase domain-containing protein [Geoalkalibacter halelectricus]
MIEFNRADNKMVLKLVYYGPALSGKTTNLLQLHELLRREGRGDLMVLDTRDDRTIYFDLLPFFLTAPSGLRIKIKVYTVPGQVRHDATRKAVLQRADGVAFIADSQLSETGNNVASFENLERNLALVGLDIATIPLVIQFNKRDLPGVVSEADIERVWRPTGIPIHLAAALNGEGVLETFSALADRTYTQLDEKWGLAAEHGLAREDFLRQLVVPG